MCRRGPGRVSQNTSSSASATPISTGNLLLLDFAFPLTTLPANTLQSKSIPSLALIIADIRDVTLNEPGRCDVVSGTTETASTD